MDSSAHLITAAIDFGTTFSGYAYGFKGDLEKSPPVVRINKWKSYSNISLKAPTAALFDETGALETFGYEAESRYAEICADGEHEKWYFFKRFKMMLHECQAITKKTVIQEAGGKYMPAIEVFAASINFLKNHLISAITERIPVFEPQSIHWVITVPAIWNDTAKHFMREAAEMAGIKGKQLTIALEPEAASVYCQTIPTEKQTDSEGARLVISKPGSKFMVLDMGGGTVDITVHERQADGTLKELHVPSGGSWGGTSVDSEFENLLKEMFGGLETGEKIFNKFKNTNMEDYVDLLHELEVKKKVSSLDFQAKTTLKIPVSLTELFEEDTQMSLSTAAANTRFGKGITKTADKLRLAQVVMYELFKPSITGLVPHLHTLLKQPAVRGLDMILMVGGFSSSAIIQDAVKTNFPDIRVYVPDQPDISVLMGAVLYGAKPEVISSRVAKFTYGLEIASPFDEHIHPESKKKVVDGKAFCKNLFSSIIHAGQCLDVGESFTLPPYMPVSPMQTEMHIKLYASAGKAPDFVTDHSCTRLGVIVVNSPDVENGLNREIEVTANFSGTELQFNAREKRSGRVYTTAINFLG